MNNIIRVGRVSSVDPAACTVRVAFDDKNGLVSYDLPVLQAQTLKNKDYMMPDVGEHVVCLFMPNGINQGFVVGAFYSDIDTPPVDDSNKRHMKFEDGTTVEYDRSTHTLTADVKGSVIITAADGITVNSDIVVNGNINATGSIIDAGGNTNHHSH